eukprot:g65371.t1
MSELSRGEPRPEDTVVAKVDQWQETSSPTPREDPRIVPVTASISAPSLSTDSCRHHSLGAVIGACFRGVVVSDYVNSRDSCSHPVPCMPGRP